MLEDFHRRRKSAPFVAAEKRAAGSRGQYQVVVAVGLAVEDDLLAFRVDVGHLPQQHLHVALLADQLAQGGCDVSTGHQASGDLIQQRLEQIEVPLVNQGDPHISLGQCLAGMHPSESPADNHHRGAWRRRSLGGLSLRKKWSPAMVAGEDLPEGYGADSGLSVLFARWNHSSLNASRNRP